MVKHRAPLTFDAALARIAGQVEGGYERLAEIAPRKYSVRTVRNWGDPDTPEHIPIDVALEFDLAFAEASGIGSPMLEAFAHQREQIELIRHGQRVALATHAAEVIRECGEAGSALVLAAQPGASPNDRTNALRECTEAYEKLKHALVLLQPVAESGQAQPP